MMHTSTGAAVVAVAMGSAGMACAQVVGFVDNAVGNSTDFSNWASTRGYAVNDDINFDAHPAGPLIADWYLGATGVTLQGDAWTADSGTGAASGSLDCPCSGGEGPMGFETYLRGRLNSTSLLMTFAQPVAGAGLMFSDLYNPRGDNGIHIEAFDASDIPLGSFDAVAFNFQLNNLYFMGVADELGRIARVEVSGPGAHGDGIFITEVRFFPAPDSVCPADLSPPPDGDSAVNTNDFFQFLTYYQAQSPAADFSPPGGDGSINTNDFFAFLAAYQAGCP